jgi:hypothetical protein
MNPDEFPVEVERTSKELILGFEGARDEMDTALAFTGDAAVIGDGDRREKRRLRTQTPNGCKFLNGCFL